MYEKPNIYKITPAEYFTLLYGEEYEPEIRRSKNRPDRMRVHNRGAITLNIGTKWVRT